MALFHTTVLDNQIKALPTVDTATGSIATFNTDLTENLVDVKCQIVAKQASGTPSPDNPLPIQTYTEMNVTRCGNNLFAPLDISTIGQTRCTLSASGQTYTMVCSGNDAWIGNLVPLGGTYVPINGTKNYIKGGSSFSITISNSDINKNYIQFFDETDKCISSVTLTSTMIAPDNAKYFTMRLGRQNASGNTYTFTVMVNYGSPLPYEDFADCTTANIPFGQTVANGVLDINSGKLRVTDGYATFDGSENWSVYSTYNYHYQINLPNVLRNDGLDINSYSSHFTGLTGYASNNASITQAVFSADGNRIRFKNVDCADLTEWKSFVTTQYNNGTPVQVVYKLATPIEIQLDSITLQALLNENNIWCDTGDTEVKFLLTVGKKIS